MSASCFHSFENCVESRKGLSSESFLVEGVLLNLVAVFFGVKEIMSASCFHSRTLCGVSQGLIIGVILGRRIAGEQAGESNK